MHGFIKLVLLAVFLTAMGFFAYLGYLNYQKYQGTKYVVDSLPRADQSFNFFDTFTPEGPSTLKPSQDLEEGSIVYSSPFSPCLDLLEDRKWNIHASQNNLLPGYITKMYYDRFWHVVWLALLPEDENPRSLFAFYGPFLLEDIPKRSFIEYLLIGKDVFDTRGLISLGPSDPCSVENREIIDFRSTL